MSIHQAPHTPAALTNTAPRGAVLKTRLPEVVPAQPIPVGGQAIPPPRAGSLRLIRENGVVRVIEFTCACGHVAYIACEYASTEPPASPT
jgi:hypothetical protein